MWSPEDLNFADERIASIFVLSSWHELFYAFTPDSNQPRLHNTSSLIEELAAIAERRQFNSRYQSHAKTVQAELSQVVEDEADILGTIPEYRSGVEHLVDESSPVAILAGCKLLGEQKALYDDAGRTAGAFGDHPKLHATGQDVGAEDSIPVLERRIVACYVDGFSAMNSGKTAGLRLAGNEWRPR